MAKYIKQAERARRDLNDRVAQLTAANIENKKAAMVNARAKSRDVDQQMGLQQNRQKAIMSLQGMKGGQDSQRNERPQRQAHNENPDPGRSGKSQVFQMLLQGEIPQGHVVNGRQKNAETQLI